MKLPKVSGNVSSRSGMNSSVDERNGILPSQTCVNTTIENGKACIIIPNNTFGLPAGKHCVDLPVSLPNGQGVSMCATPCGPPWFPTGACLTVRRGRRRIFHQCVGLC